MRAKTYYSERPQPYEIKSGGAGQAVVYLRQSIEETPTGDGWQYTADEYTLTVPMSPSLAERVAADFEKWLDKAVREDRERTAAEVRAIRDRLLAESDKEMVLDRQGIEAPAGTTFTAWLGFLRAIGEHLGGSMAKYRQALRDLPQQEGFPYEVEFPTWPVRPEEKGRE